MHSLRSRIAPVGLYVTTSATKPCKAQGCSFTVHSCWKLGWLQWLPGWAAHAHPLVLTEILVLLLFHRPWHWLPSTSRQPRPRPCSLGWRERRLLCQPSQHSLRPGKLPLPLLPWHVCLPLNSRLIKMFCLLKYDSISANSFFLVFPSVSKSSFRKLLEREKEGFLSVCICFCRHCLLQNRNIIYLS